LFVAIRWSSLAFFVGFGPASTRSASDRRLRCAKRPSCSLTASWVAYWPSRAFTSSPAGVEAWVKASTMALGQVLRSRMRRSASLTKSLTEISAPNSLT